MVPGSPFMCMTTTPQSLSAATCTMTGSRKPDTSLMMAAPASTHAFATAAWRVSTLTQTPCSARARTTGSTRAVSSSTLTSADPERVDSPPTSIICAPSSSICCAQASAASGVLCVPPSLKLSGVTLRMPMITGLRVSNSNEPHFHIMLNAFLQKKASLTARLLAIP